MTLAITQRVVVDALERLPTAADNGWVPISRLVAETTLSYTRVEAASMALVAEGAIESRVTTMALGHRGRLTGSVTSYRVTR